MTIKKILIPISGNDVAPRFDLATEVLIFILSKEHQIQEERTVVLPGPSAEKLCHLILTENIHILICGAIEDEFYQFLRWKKITLFDAVISSWQDAFNACIADTLTPEAILYPRMVEGTPVIL